MFSDYLRLRVALGLGFFLAVPFLLFVGGACFSVSISIAVGQISAKAHLRIAGVSATQTSSANCRIKLQKRGPWFLETRRLRLPFILSIDALVSTSPSLVTARMDIVSRGMTWALRLVFRMGGAI